MHAHDYIMLHNWFKAKSSKIFAIESGGIINAISFDTYCFVCRICSWEWPNIKFYLSPIVIILFCKIVELLIPHPWFSLCCKFVVWLWNYLIIQRKSYATVCLMINWNEDTMVSIQGNWFEYGSYFIPASMCAAKGCFILGSFDHTKAATYHSYNYLPMKIDTFIYWDRLSLRLKWRHVLTYIEPRVMLLCSTKTFVMKNELT